MSRFVTWRKSLYSASNGACVEVAPEGDGVMMRDSKNPDGPVLHFTAAEWDAFIKGVKDGEFDTTAPVPAALLEPDEGIVGPTASYRT